MKTKLVVLSIVLTLAMALLMSATGWTQSSRSSTSMEGTISDMTENTFNLVFECSYDAKNFINEGNVKNGDKAYVWCYKNMAGAPSQKVMLFDSAKPYQVKVIAY